MPTRIAMLAVSVFGLTPLLPAAEPAARLWSERVPSVQGAPEFFVAPDGKPDGKGTKAAPWDIVSTLAGKQAVPPGSIVWLRGGTYTWAETDKHAYPGFEVLLQGAEGKPIHVRPVSGERVTLDGGIHFGNKAKHPTLARHVWLWDVEVIVSRNVKEVPRTDQAGSFVKWDRPIGGVTLYSSEECKLINLSVHHNTGVGVSLWSSAIGGEVHGNLIHNNGWIGPDRNHGHGIYAQSKDGTKHLTDNVIFANQDHMIQSYGSDSAFVDHFRIEGNIGFGPLPKAAGRLLIGGKRPASDILMKDNFLFGINAAVGYLRRKDFDNDAHVEGNTVLRGALSTLGWKKMVAVNNTVWQGVDGEATPQKPFVFLRPNRYDPRRANLAVADIRKADSVSADLGAFLKPGDRYRLHAATDFYGAPVAKGTYSGKPVEVPLQPLPNVPDRELGVYVVLKD